jgi:hypothetical protein
MRGTRRLDALSLTFLVGLAAMATTMPACFAGGLAQAGRASEGTLRFDSRTQTLETVPVESYAPHFIDSAQAWESWDYAFRFPDGTSIFAQFQVTSLGPGKHRGVVVGVLILPDGRSVLIKNGRPRDQWSSRTDENGIELSIARHRLEIRPPSHKLHLENGRGRITLETTSRVPAARPGRLKYDGDKFYDLTVLAPRLSARATIEIPGSAALQLENGDGVGLHAFSNVADYKQAASWLRFHTFDDPLQVSFLEFTAPKKQAFQRVRFLVLAQEGAVLRTSVDYERSYAGFQEDPEKPHYPIPSRFHLRDRSERTELSGSADLRLRRRDDLLSWLDSSLLRFLVRRFSHPVQYFFDADYELSVDLGNGPQALRGTGLANLVILNQPPKDSLW